MRKLIMDEKTFYDFLIPIRSLQRELDLATINILSSTAFDYLASSLKDFHESYIVSTDIIRNKLETYVFE
jgi:hypothetical protein